MWAFLERILDSSMFSPHGICLLWEPELIWLHVVSDAVIAMAYFSIPFALAIFVSKRRDLSFDGEFHGFVSRGGSAVAGRTATKFRRSIRAGLAPHGLSVR
jgi:hypothetical protein